MGAGQWERIPSSRPLPGKTTVVVMTASSQSVGPFGAQTYQIRVATAGQPAFIKVGDGTPTADTTSPRHKCGRLPYCLARAERRGSPSWRGRKHVHNGDDLNMKKKIRKSCSLVDEINRIKDKVDRELDRLAEERRPKGEGSAVPRDTVRQLWMAKGGGNAIEAYLAVVKETHAPSR